MLFPNVIRTEEGYLMFYDAWSLRGDEGIGLATSPDGVTWTRYDDPATTDALYAHGDPVFSAEGHADWDRRTMRPSVVLTPDGFVMAYLGLQESDRSNAYGLAFSEDGIHWERYSGNPVMTLDDLPIDGNLQEHRLFYIENTYFLFFQAGTYVESDIWLAVFEGDLTPPP